MYYVEKTNNYTGDYHDMNYSDLILVDNDSGKFFYCYYKDEFNKAFEGTIYDSKSFGCDMIPVSFEKLSVPTLSQWLLLNDIASQEKENNPYFYRSVGGTNFSVIHERLPLKGRIVEIVDKKAVHDYNEVRRYIVIDHRINQAKEKTCRLLNLRTGKCENHLVDDIECNFDESSLMRIRNYLRELVKEPTKNEVLKAARLKALGRTTLACQSRESYIKSEKSNYLNWCNYLFNTLKKNISMCQTNFQINSNSIHKQVKTNSKIQKPSYDFEGFKKPASFTSKKVKLDVKLYIEAS